MRDRISKKIQADIKLVKSNGGVFEITIDGNLVFSKKATGKFPTDEDVSNLIKS